MIWTESGKRGFGVRPVNRSDNDRDFTSPFDAATVRKPTSYGDVMVLLVVEHSQRFSLRASFCGLTDPSSVQSGRLTTAFFTHLVCCGHLKDARTFTSRQP